MFEIPFSIPLEISFGRKDICFEIHIFLCVWKISYTASENFDADPY